MTDRERRQPVDIRRAARLREGLTPQQLAALPTLEQFRWRLEFVRRPLFRAPVPVLSDRDRSRVVVLEADGSIDEAPDIQLRGAPLDERMCTGNDGPTQAVATRH